MGRRLAWGVGSGFRTTCNCEVSAMTVIWPLTLAARVPFSFLMRFVIAFGILVFGPIPVASASSQEKAVAPPGLERLADDPDYTDVSALPNVHVELRYASENNFLGKNLYGGFHRCFLHRVAAEKFRRAAHALEERRP